MFSPALRLLALGAILSPFTAQAQSLPEVVDGVRNFDYVAATAKEPVKVTWLVVNGGDQPFSVLSGQSSSEALTATWRTSGIETGQRLVIEGLFDPKKHLPGRVVEQLLVKTDAGQTLRLTATGYVLKAGETAPAPARPTPAPDRSAKVYGYLSRYCTEAIAPAYKAAAKFSENRAAVKLGDKYGYINAQGTFVTDTKYDWGSPFHNGLAPVRVGRKWGLIDLTGQEVVPLEYDRFDGGFENGAWAVVRDKRGYFVDGYGRDLGYVKDPAVEAVSALSGGRVFLFKKSGKWGVMNTDGQELLPPTYDQHEQAFRNGRALVFRGELRGWIDETGHEIVPCTLGWASPFSEGKGVGHSEGAANNQVYGRTGKVLFTVNFPSLNAYHAGRALATQGITEKTYIDAEGKQVVSGFLPFAFDYSDDGYAAAGLSMYGWDYLDWSVHGLASPQYDTVMEMAIFEGDNGLGAACNYKAQPSLGSEPIARRSANGNDVRPEEGAAMARSAYKAGLRLAGTPPMAGVAAPPLGGAVLPAAAASVPSKPAATGAKAAAKVAAKPAKLAPRK